MKKRKINYFLLLSLFFAIAVLIFIAGCDPEQLPIIVSFLANPTTIMEGESSTLSWSISVNCYSATIDNGIGSVALEGATTVSPTKTTTYTLTATNSVGTVTESVTVHVLTPADIVYTTLQPGPAEGKDALVSSLFPDTAYGNGEVIDVGNNSVATVRIFIEFDLSSIPENAVVVNADLWLYQYSTPYEEEDFEVGLHKVTNAWDEDTLTWNLQPPYSTEVETSKTLIVGEKVWTVWDTDDLVQDWLNEPILNYGCALIDTDETSVDTIVYFHSSDYTTDPDKRPKLVINFYIPYVSEK